MGPPVITIRPLTPDDPADIAGMAGVISAVTPQHAMGADTLAHQLRTLAEHPRQPHFQGWLAEDGGHALGQASVYQVPGMFHPDRYWAEVMVRPEAQSLGIGTELGRVVEAHLRARGAQEVLSGAYEDDLLALRYLIDRDFTESMRHFDNVLDLGSFDLSAWRPQLTLPAGLRAVTLAELRAETGQGAADRAFYEAFAEARLDVPRSGEATEHSFAAFEKRLSGPHFSPDLIWLALTGAGEVVALTELRRSDTDPARLDTGLTGTRRAWRRRGLGLALKLRATGAAQAGGYRELWTGNATTNTAMLALNGRLGFVPRPAFIEFRWGRLVL